MENKSNQIFQTSSYRRWKSFKWVGRIILLLCISAVIFIYFALKNMYIPNIPSMNDNNAYIDNAIYDKVNYKESRIAKEYSGFARFIKSRWSGGKTDHKHKKEETFAPASAHINDSLGIRAGFYVSWDPQSLTSLRQYASSLNYVIPEWLFIDPNADTLISNVDLEALDVIKKSHLRVMPMLTNFVNDENKFDGDIMHRILHDPAKKKRLIDDIDKFLTKNNFQGVNIDFEELKETSNEPLSQFQQELYNQLHAKGLLVTQDVMPFNEDYNYKALVKYNDYLFLMAYDEFSTESQPGPVSSQKWIEAAVDHITQQIPSEKIILCIAGYGYDWAKGKQATNVTYQEALSRAKNYNAKIIYDNDTYNLRFAYTDENKVSHTVFCTDAATNFNTLRFASEEGLAGTAMWRLGSEDSRIWQFYNRPMDKASLKSFDFKKFSQVSAKNNVDYLGEGEILNVKSTPRSGYISCELDTISLLISEESYDTLPSTYVVERFGKPEGKKMVLTFDDGPDPLYTRQILDTLAKYRVPGVFFLVGIEAEKNIPLVKRIYREGHEIGNHTFFHPNMAKVSTDRAFLEMNATRLLIECITGHSTIMFRAPYNADSEPQSLEEIIPVALSRNNNYLTIGESIDPEDWQASEDPTYNADTIFNRIVRMQNKGNIILLHDAGGPREATVEALPRIIKYFKDQGYTFTTVADLMGKSRNELMPPIPKGTGYYIIQINLALAEFGYYVGHILFYIFLAFLTLSMIRLVVLGILAYREKRKWKKNPLSKLPGSPKVSIIVPAYNEEVNAVSSLHNLLKCDYPNFEIIFVDDGSKDSTYDKVFSEFNEHPKVKVFSKPNGGKASALNFGIAKSAADFVVCIDADTQLKSDAVSMMMRHFSDDKVGAVAGTVKVGNEKNILTKWQSIEYISSQNFDRKAFAYINAITVIPGAIGTFRKEVIFKAGGFTTDTLAEDCDLTIRILEAGYIVANEPAAVAYTEAPESLKQFMKQRFRWSFGVLQTFWKHKNLLFNRHYKSLGMFALPDMLLFKYIIPLFAPIADLLMLLGIATGNGAKIGLYYLIFVVVDAAIALFAFSMEKENPGKLIWLVPQRLIYRWIMLVVLFRAFRRAIKGELQHWGVLKRTGNVQVAGNN